LRYISDNTEKQQWAKNEQFSDEHLEVIIDVSVNDIAKDSANDVLSLSLNWLDWLQIPTPSQNFSYYHSLNFYVFGSSLLENRNVNNLLSRKLKLNLSLWQIVVTRTEVSHLL
jgi:hypothetical protein